MQGILDFGAETEIAGIRKHLLATFGPLAITPRREPMSQLVKSLISGRTLDAVSLRAFDRLVSTYPRWADLAEAPPEAIEKAIAEVTFPQNKARHLAATLRIIGARDRAFRLDFLAGWPIARALAWLESLPGVGREVATATLNFSTLQRPVFVVDTHVLRILRRFGLVRPTAPTERAHDAVTAATNGWRAAELAELQGLLKRLGQTACRPDGPRCDLCPLRQICQVGRMCQFAGAGATTKRR